MDKQEQRERSVFTAFAKVCELGLIPDSVEKRNPPEPGILCKTKFLGPVAFEMVEVIDQSLARRTYDQLGLERFMWDAYQKLPLHERKDVKARYADARIHVAFRPNASLTQRKKIVNDMFQLMRTRRGSFTGEISPNSNSSLGRTVRKLAVRRGSFTGPCFRVEGAGSFADPVVRRVSEKLGAHYNSNFPMELLAYYELQPQPFDWVWQELRTAVELRLKKSGFRRVWVYNHVGGKIQFVYPR